MASLAETDEAGVADLVERSEGVPWSVAVRDCEVELWAVWLCWVGYR